jgi:hypothetical protein
MQAIATQWVKILLVIPALGGNDGRNKANKKSLNLGII